MSLSQYRLSPGAIFILLLLASVVSLLLPPRWTDSLKSAAQLLVPPQDLFYSATAKAVKRVSDVDRTRDSNAALIEQLQAELGAERAATNQLRGENDRLRKLRAAHELPNLPLLPAKIVALDVVEWRDSALVARGSTRGVRYRDWVSSRFFVDQGRASEIEEGQAVLTRECLLGRVEQVSPYMARVQLLSDVDSPRVEVRIATTNGKAVRLLDLPCSLRGMGKGRMAIENVGYQYVQASQEDAAGAPQRIRVGDLVFSAPGQFGLPVPIVIGKIVEIKENPQKRLVLTLTVEPMMSVDVLREVFIIPLVPVVPTSF
jgi:cell shape-determining protein MreC